MELLLSQHWRLPTAIVIPTLQNRLECCFHKGITMTVEIDSVDWEVALGQSLPSELLQSIRLMDRVEGSIPLDKVRLGNTDVLKILRQEWYIQKTMLFISEDISPEALDVAIYSWLHELKLHQCQKTPR